MKRIGLLILSAIFAFIITFTACGGSSMRTPGNSGGNPVANAVTAGFGALPGLAKSVVVNGKVASAHFLGGFSASAASPVSISGSYTGFCQSTPSGAEFVVYGLGRDTDSNCQANYSNFSNTGSPIIGDGTITNLIVTGQGGTDPASGVVHVFLNATKTDTGVTCTLGVTTRCDAATNIAVKDNDFLVVTMTTQAGDQYQNVHVILIKQ